MKSYTFVVLTNAEDGRENEFNDWYTNRHLSDVIGIPGVVSARRFRIAAVQRPVAVSPYKYLALYEIETDDLAQVVEALAKRSGTEMMPVSDAMSAEKFNYIFEAITEKRTNDQYGRE
jgi:hypothetical protein